MNRYNPKPWDIRRCDMVPADDGKYVQYDDALAQIERLTNERAHIIAERDKTFALMLERAEKAEADAEFFKSEVKLRNRIPSTNDTAADLLRRAEKAEAERDSFQAMFRSCLKGNDALREKAQKANTERDEARAQVATAYERAAYEADFYSYLAGNKIRALTSADTKAALEAYGREKVREGLEIAITAMNGVLRRGPNEWAFGTGGYSNPMDAARDAILAEMEKLK